MIRSFSVRWRYRTLKGNLHPAAVAANDRGIVEDSAPLGNVILLLNRAPEQEKQLDAMIDQLHNSKSPKYHQWLTAEQFGEEYGLSDADLKTVTDWLQSKGFTIEDVPPGRTYIVFTGTVGQIRTAFHTEIHKINVHGELHRANMSEPEVPAALAPAIRGFRQLTDFRAKPLLVKAGAVKHNSKTGAWERVPTSGVAPAITFTYNSSTFYSVTPQDFYTIYNENPELSSAINGAGVTIAVIEETEVVNQSDVASFRSQFGLPTYPATPNSTQGGVNWIYGPGHGCTAPPDPTSTGEEGEALLDVEWAGTVN
jgi:subtilase family serine protease